MQYLRQQADQSVRTTTLCFRLRVEHAIVTSVIGHKNYRIKFMSFELTVKTNLSRNPLSSPPPVFSPGLPLLPISPSSLSPPSHPLALTRKTILIPDSPISYTCFFLEIQCKYLTCLYRSLMDKT